MRHVRLIILHDKNEVLKKQHAPRATNFGYHSSQENRILCKCNSVRLLAGPFWIVERAREIAEQKN